MPCQVPFLLSYVYHSKLDNQLFLVCIPGLAIECFVFISMISSLVEYELR
jgi:hypothetical protein